MKIVDVLIYVHPELLPEDWAKVEQGVLASAGVISANFDKHKHPHALTVEYNPDAVQSNQILEVARRYDPAATMVAL